MSSWLVIYFAEFLIISVGCTLMLKQVFEFSNHFLFFLFFFCVVVLLLFLR